MHGGGHGVLRTPTSAVPPTPAAGRPSCRLVRVVAELNFGGTELRIVDLLPRLVEAGVEMHLVTLSDHIGPGPLAPAVRRYGGVVEPIPLDVRFPVRFTRLLRQLRPDVVHADCANFSGTILSMAAATGVPTRVAHFRSDDNQPRNLRRRVQRWTWHQLLRASATDILGVSPGALAHGYRPGWESDRRARVVLNGLDLDRLRQPPECDLRATFGIGDASLLCVNVGRAAPVKRRWLLPPIVAALGERGVDAHVVLVGPSCEEDDALVHEAAVRAGVTDRVHLLGARDDIGGLLSQADVVVHPSRLEGLPGSVLEPVALGIGTVASDLPGVRFVDEHLPGVFIVDPHAEADRWAEAVLAAADFTTATLPEEAVDRFERSIFSIDTAAAVHLAMYHRLDLARPSGAPSRARRHTRTWWAR